MEEWMRLKTTEEQAAGGTRDKRDGARARSNTTNAITRVSPQTSHREEGEQP